MQSSETFNNSATYFCNIAHNNSLIMQNFLPKEEGGGNFKELLAMPEILQANNIMIVDQISNLVELLEILEK
jgi:hypothetical protein